MTRAWKSPSLLLALAVVLCACQDSRSSDPTQSSGQFSSVVTLRYGETTFVQNIEIRFGAVLEDSRCPTQVQCIAAGNAKVELGVGPPRGTEGPTHQVLLNTSGGSSGEAWGLRVTLLSVSPYPAYPEPIPAEHYAVKLKVESLRALDATASFSLPPEQP